MDFLALNFSNCNSKNLFRSADEMGSYNSSYSNPRREERDNNISKCAIMMNIIHIQFHDKKHNYNE